MITDTKLIRHVTGCDLPPSLISSIVRGKGHFVLCLANTKTSDIEGISAAGINAERRRLTSTLDAEALMLGSTVSDNTLPISPLGIISPVIISRACLSQPKLNIDTTIVDCGTFFPPKVEHISLNKQIANCVSSANALPLPLVNKLFQAGLELGAKWANSYDYIVLAECVPGGTTTAQAVLSALGYNVENLLSSSLPSGNQNLKRQLIEQGFEQARKNNLDFSKPDQCIAAFGDAMQITIAGIALGIEGKLPIILAGGSQMLAVWAILKAMSSSQKLVFSAENIFVVTTKWVIDDPSAKCAVLSDLLEANLSASCPDFHKSRYNGLKAYERNNVKEGVGAGASLALVYWAGCDQDQIMQSIDNTYDSFVGS